MLQNSFIDVNDLINFNKQGDHYKDIYGMSMPYDKY